MIISLLEASTSQVNALEDEIGNLTNEVIPLGSREHIAECVGEQTGDLVLSHMQKQNSTFSSTSLSTRRISFSAARAESHCGAQRIRACLPDSGREIVHAIRLFAPEHIPERIFEHIVEFPSFQVP